MALPAWSFLFVGLFVTVVSAQSDRLAFFYYVGILFLVWGAFKLAVGYLSRQPAKKEERFIERKMAPEIAACHHCGAAVYVTANYCHACGTRLR